MPEQNAPKILIATSSPMALWAFFRPQIRFLLQQGFQVHTVSSPGPLLNAFTNDVPVPASAIPMQRRISPAADLLALARMWRLVRQVRPGIAHAHTPKAGLICMAAAALAGVKVRIYTIHGLPLETRTGWRRLLLAAAERFTCSMATDVFSVSRSLREQVVARHLCPAEKVRLTGDGACAGINLIRFAPTDADGIRAARLRCDIPNQASVLLFAGRFVRDKGFAELAAAWQRLSGEFPALHLLLCGEFEDEDPPDRSSVAALRADPRVHWSAGFETDMRSAYAAADICLMPTYREGLPTVALESAAMEKPVVATRVTGCVDAVIDGVTGLLVSPRDSAAMACAVAELLRDPERRAAMGRAGREFVSARFSEERVASLVSAEYRRLLSKAERVPSGGAARRIADVAGAGALLLLLAPVLAVAALAVRLFVGAPVLFRQTRGGLGGRTFELLKFRTMTGERDASGRLLADERRLTRAGRRLRATSIDELPQLWNVLRGDMSIVGPRPLMAEYLPRYSEFEMRRHEVKPGITGWAQIHGRNAMSWDERFALDVWYVDHRSWRLDLRILLLTTAQLVQRASVRAAGEVVMPEFRGRETS